jgi:PAS domain S-box-containing protein
VKRDLERDPHPPAESITSAFGATFAAAPCAAVLTDAGGRLVWMNEASCSLFGGTEETLVGAAFETLVHPQDRHDEGERVRGLIAAEQHSYRCRQRLLGPDGHWFEADVAVWRLTGGSRLLRLDPADLVGHGPLLARLIQPSAAGGDEITTSEAATHAILADVPEGVAITDASGAVAVINPALEAMTGLSVDDVRGRPVAEAVPILDATCRALAGAEHFLTRAFEAGQTVTNLGHALTVRAPDGSRIPVAVTAAPVYDAAGTLLGGVQIIRDVSQERAADELRSTLVSTVSHELRTPLAIIVGYCEILMTRKLDDARAREALERINSSAKRLSRLIEDLILVSRIETGRTVVRPRAMDVRTAVDEVVASVGEERSFVLEMTEGLPPVMADPDMLAHILTNLLSNAVKYSEEVVTVSAWQAGDLVTISVADRGVGVSESEMEHMFGRFFRSERPEVRRVEGTGLGLFITKSLVELLGGRIGVESALGEGTTVRFTLPAAPATA